MNLLGGPFRDRDPRHRTRLRVLLASTLSIMLLQKISGPLPVLTSVPFGNIPLAPLLDRSFSQGEGRGNVVSTRTFDVAEGIPSLRPSRVALLASFGISILAIEPLGARVLGLDLRLPNPPCPQVLDALQQEMASRGFLVFVNQGVMTAAEQIRASELWGGREMHSTHGEHPTSADRHIFRISNDPGVGIVGVGPGWHNDGSFERYVFSHVGYHIVRLPEKGGNTFFAHQSAAYSALSAVKRERWARLVSVNSNTGVLHPMVHKHPISGRPAVFLHLGMTGAIIEMLPQEKRFQLLDEEDMVEVFQEYNNLLNSGLSGSVPYAISYPYREGDCIFIDNLAIAHHASTEAHADPESQGLRILHRTTVKATKPFLPGFGLPPVVDIHGPRPGQFTHGVWRGGNVGFVWDPTSISVVPSNTSYR